MNFQCKELSISDDVFGFTITFSDTEYSDEQNMSEEERMNLKEKYLLIMRAYPEDEFDDGYYHIESSETDTELNPKDKMGIRFSRKSLEIDWSGDHLEIGLDLTDREHKDLEEAFENVFEERVIILNE